MSYLDTADNSDGSMDSVVERIMGKMQPGDAAPAPKPAKEQVRASEAQTETDPVVEAEAEPETEDNEAEAGDAKAKADAKADDAEDEEFEIPAEAEGGEPIKAKLSELVASHKQMRQMNTSIAATINKHEAEYIAEQDKVLGGLKTTYETVRERAEAALRTIPAPQPPNRLLLDRNAGYYDPETYLAQQAYYEEQVAAIRHFKTTADEARQAEQKVQEMQVSQHAEREYARLARHPGFEEFADPIKREVRETEMVDKLGKHFGITVDDLKGVQSHKLWILANAAIAAAETKVKAPEVRKQVKESAVRATRTRAQPQGANGRFILEARKELAETGTTDAFAKLLIQSGALR